MSRFGKAWRRFASMGWDERRTRVAQEVDKRLDLALYHTGLLTRRSDVRQRSDASEGKFFFSPAELADRISLIKTKLSETAEDIVRQADRICGHHFDLLGYENLDYGAQIDWHLDVVHGKRAPLKPWFKIDFLNAEEVGDHKIIWELNRHQHLVTLAKARSLTRDRRYVTELEAQWYSWERENPYPIGINWASSLEVAFRTLSWIWVLALLSECDAVAPDFRNDVIRGLAVNGRFIERNLSTYFSPNTHLLGEVVALFFIGVLFPDIAAADRWRRNGWQILVDQSRRQVRTDGVYFEQSLYYHVYALDFFLHARILADHNGIAVPSELDAVLNKMLDVVFTLSQGGATEGFGDDDGGRVFDPRRNRCQHMTDPLALGAILFQREDLKAAAQLTEEAIWLFGEQISCMNRSRKIEVASFGESGIYVMGSGKQVPLQMIVDAGPQGTGRSGHGHADALSVSVVLDGRRWLVDSGALSYVDTDRDRFRGTGAHNTVRVDGVDQAIPDGPFAWKSIPEVRCEKWIAGEGFTFFSGSHNGYARLVDPVLHCRYIFYLHDEFWVVRDVLQGKEEHEIEVNWHFSSDIDVAPVASYFMTSLKDHSAVKNVPLHLALIPVADLGWSRSVLADFVSPAYGRKDPASTVSLRHRAKLPLEHATILLPLSAPDNVGRFSRVQADSSKATVYSYSCKESENYMIFANSQTEAWNWNSWSGDARFLYFSVENGVIVHLVCCEGRKLALNGVTILSHPRCIERLEWNRQNGHTSSSDDSVTSISAEVLKSFVPA